MMVFLKTILVIVIACSAAIILARIVFPLPSISERAKVESLPPDAEGALGRLALALAKDVPGKTGVMTLNHGHDAIGSRFALAVEAQSSIDAQYYIWHDDTTGRLLLKALYDAAQRGVRVRLLLDDNGVPGLDQTIAALNSLPNFEIRLFNPSTVRTPKLAGYTFDFLRMNRRMHNKAFIVDGAAAIIGGRNIGNEYFEIGENFYLDLDVLAIGAIVPKTSAAFDEYWNSLSVYQSELIISPESGNIDAFLEGVDEALKQPEAKFLDDLEATSTDRFADGEARFEWTDVDLVSDDPSKGLGLASRDQLMITRLGSILGTIDETMDLASAYFVPGKQGTAFFSRLAERGIRVRIMTNAYETTDVPLVHSGYTKYRDELLMSGVELFELKPVPGAPAGKDELNVIGSSGASLHAKTFAVDGRRIFIGSFNFDPRSAMLNCEMGFLIDSPSMAKKVGEIFGGSIPSDSYQMKRDANGTPTWTETAKDGSPILHDREPGTTMFSRALMTALGWLPIEWML